MRISILPKTRLGWWSVSLAVAFIILEVLHQIFVMFVQRVSVPNPPQPIQFIRIALFAGFASAIAAFITGLIGIIRSKERSILVFVVVMIGFLILIFLLGELIFPH